MRKLSADYIFGKSALLQKHLLEVSDDGEIISLRQEGPGEVDVDRFVGIICPGFVNTHCHIELSHLHGKIPKLTGMVPFVEHILAGRDGISEAEKISSMDKAIASMWEKGISAVGDICNRPDSKSPKENHSEMLFRNFIEVFGLDPLSADHLVHEANSLKSHFGEKKSSINLHAPYSISEKMRDLVYLQAGEQGSPMTVHMLESKEERELFDRKTGTFLAFFHRLQKKYQAESYTSGLEFILKNMPANSRHFVFAHMTEVEELELSKVIDEYSNVWFALCPAANRYIHGTLPDGNIFAKVASDRTCIGTDSLAGNETLDILEELKTLQFHFPELSTALLLKWATQNGAEALDFGDQIGRFEEGLTPGVVLITGIDAESGKFMTESKARRII